LDLGLARLLAIPLAILWGATGFTTIYSVDAARYLTWEYATGRDSLDRQGATPESISKQVIEIGPLNIKWQREPPRSPNHRPQKTL
jgi:hypothetical protein